MRFGLPAIALALSLAVLACASPKPSPTDVAEATQGMIPTPIPTPAPAVFEPRSAAPLPSGLTVSEAIALRDSGELGSDPFTLVGYWTERLVVHSCGAPPQPQGEIDVYCSDGEYGITEENEAIAHLTNDRRLIPATSPHLTPWMPHDIANMLLGGRLPREFPPTPIAVSAHFNDPRAASCHPARLQICQDRLIIDKILVLDASSVPPATPAPTPTPFPSPAPPGLFDTAHCAGDVAYGFIGWTTTQVLNIGFQRPGHVFAMVTEDVIPIGGWIDDPNGSGQKFRWWGRQVCLTWDTEIGRPFNEVLMEFASVRGTGFKEWEDGRRVPGDAP